MNAPAVADRPRWTVEWADDTRRGFWYLADSQRWDDRYVLPGREKSALEYAATVLNAGGLDDDDLELDDLEHIIESEVILRVACPRCERHHFAGESSPDGRCPDCAP